MSGIVPFAQCIARPSKGEERYWLSEHLLAVKTAMETRLQGTLDDAVLTRLGGLAGVCHDLVKCHWLWQSYINGKRTQGPNHAPEGAFLFSYLGYHWLQAQNKWDKYAREWLWLVRDIADHHGVLKKVKTEDNWMKNGPWQELDLPGIAEFLQRIYREDLLPDLSIQALRQWMMDLDDMVEFALDALDAGTFPDRLSLMEELIRWRELTTALISGDRFHVSAVNSMAINQARHSQHDGALDEYCKGRADADTKLTVVRQAAQAEILRQLTADPSRLIYTLEMPTGYGKTITALRLATWLGKQLNYEKIIYVAPYLSILEQNSSVFEEALQEAVLEHHSLAVLPDEQGKKVANGHEIVDEEGELPDGQLVMESWAAPIVCTSFQQFCKALFPGRAQDALRRAFLAQSVVIIDEPQIFAAPSWNVFLHGLEAVAKLYHLKVIFLSATMPPFDYGLSKKNQPGRLSVAPAAKVERYQVEQAGAMDEQMVAEYLVNYQPDQPVSQAAIVNTITDAYLVYQSLERQVDSSALKLLHGMMVPLHKRVEIEKIKALSSRKESERRRLYVVSTQILEAGVDLSFQHIMRALPILPSIIQAAGRVNRHFGGAMGLLTLMLFLRDGEKNTRSFIYAPGLQQITDILLARKKVWVESELLELIKEYYREMFTRNTYEAGKSAIHDAYEGDWPALGQNFKPFGEDVYRLPIFVPWQVPKEDKNLLPIRFVDLQKQFKLYSPEEIYERYQDRDYYTQLTFREKKEFMILMNHYVINVPPKLAFSLVEREVYLENKIPCLLNQSDYHLVCGLAEYKVKGFDQYL
ncbi:CRISPR-associated helicase Cas3' [Propionispora hippei]|uniref:CRISPR-associated helicase, Cas3 family n=1 Tax=Propionispora hippei DSM 15287 TaxID=1123003 RepID=A0A1M6KU88_9FIRM|nr:CRISPR-associated helicase Cas3' [Propionispora hippei]SHJ62531.1 CRISPR-associated helicase, Cas3 family [Propionispora hippei DSM 15287]